MVDTTERAIDAARVIEIDFVRATEAAALNALKWLGRGDKIAADDAATDAMRGTLNLVDMRGLCIIGEGIKDEAPGIFTNEKLGTWSPTGPRVDFAIDPIDGTSLTAKGLPGAISVLAATVVADGTDRALAELPAVYSYKLAYGPAVREAGGGIDMDAPIAQTLKIVAERLGKRVADLVVALLDRPRHKDLISQIRKAGARIRLIGDGDVAMAIAPSMLNSTVDLYVGIGGSPEAVIAAAAVKCLAGQMHVRMWPRDDKERDALVGDGWGDQLKKVYDCDGLASGSEIMFAATGISDSPMLPGILLQSQHVHTHSILMRSRYRTVRYIHAIHDLSHKTIRLASDEQEHLL